MFNLFKRKKLLDWEIALLSNVINLLPDKYKCYNEQIRKKLFGGVRVNTSDIKGYVKFLVRSEVVEEFYNERAPSIKLHGIKVFDLLQGRMLDYDIYSFNGYITGYAINEKKHNIDINRIDVTGFKVSYLDSEDYDQIKTLLSPAEKKLLNPSDVYVVSLNDKDYYHIKDLEDGDFIGMDLDKHMYKITHDPFEIKLLDSGLGDILKTAEKSN